MSTHQPGVSLLDRCVNDKVTVGAARLRLGHRPRRLEPSARPASFAYPHLYLFLILVYVEQPGVDTDVSRRTMLGSLKLVPTRDSFGRPGTAATPNPPYAGAGVNAI